MSHTRIGPSLKVRVGTQWKTVAAEHRDANLSIITIIIPLSKVRDEEGRNAWPDETYSVEQVDNVFGLFIV